MKKLIFDASTLITLTVSCNLWILEKLKEKAEFIVPEAVWDETVGKSLNIDRFKLEGVRLKRYFDLGIIKVVSEPRIKQLSERILSLTNNSFVVNGRPIEIIHRGEAEMIALAVVMNAPYLAIDERTTRVLIEKPEAQKSILEGKLHTKVKANYNKINEFKEIVKGIKVLRSIDLLLYAYKLNFFNVGVDQKINLLRGLIWSAKERGCALTSSEMSAYINMYSRDIT